MKIAIDGPAASGKGTLGRLITEHYNSQFGVVEHIDSGSLYRIIGLQLHLSNVKPDESHSVKRFLRRTKINQYALTDLFLHKEEIGGIAAMYSPISEVRQKVNEYIYEQVKNSDFVVIDGRDIGTVVCPDATVKLFVTASPEVRAQRRFREVDEKGSGSTYEQILADIMTRDERDMGRADSPLKPAADAHLIDTSEMSIETAFGQAKALIDAALNEQ